MKPSNSKPAGFEIAFRFELKFQIRRIISSFNKQIFRGDQAKYVLSELRNRRRHSNQFCRACGANLKTVRTILEKPDAVTDSAAKARDEIGSAFAQQIRQISKASELNKIAEEGLPYIEKFLESPEERRLRRIRTGSILAFIGLGVAIAFSIVGSVANEKLLVLAGLGIVCLFIGAAFLINGLLFSVPKKAIVDKSSEGENQRQLDYIDPETNELKLPESNQVFSSVTEQTTRQLKQKQPISRD